MFCKQRGLGYRGIYCALKNRQDLRSSGVFKIPDKLVLGGKGCPEKGNQRKAPKENSLLGA